MFVAALVEWSEGVDIGAGNLDVEKVADIDYGVGIDRQLRQHLRRQSFGISEIRQNNPIFAFIFAVRQYSIL